MTAHIEALFVYPLKGAAGTSVPAFDLDDVGPAGDRRWLVVDEDGTFVSQRELASLALVRPSVEDDVLVLAAQATDGIRVPAPREGTPVRVRIWRDHVDARDAGDLAAAWLGRVLGRRLRLVWMPEDAVRPVDPAYGRPGDRVSFADAFPLLLLSRASLDALNERLASPLPMNRFRPNVVVGGVAPHAEDGWRTIAVGDVTIDVVKPCGRCVVTTIDQATGVAGREPLRTLAEYRRGEGGVVYFGQNAIHRARGRIRVGQPVHVVA